MPTGGPAITPDGRFVYEALYGPTSGTLDVVNTSDNKVVDTVALGPRPNSVMISPNGREVYVPILAGPTKVLGVTKWTPTQNGWLSVIDVSSNSVVATVTVGFDPVAAAWGPVDSI